MSELTVGVDIGGTKIQVAVVRDQDVVGEHRIMTPQHCAKELIAAIGIAVAKVLADLGAGTSDVAGIGVGVPGAVDGSAGTVENANNVPGLEGTESVPLAAMVSEVAGGSPVKLENDVRVAILGEWKRGAGARTGTCSACGSGPGSGAASS